PPCCHIGIQLPREPSRVLHSPDNDIRNFLLALAPIGPYPRTPSPSRNRRLSQSYPDTFPTSYPSPFDIKLLFAPLPDHDRIVAPPDFSLDQTSYIPRCGRYLSRILHGQSADIC